MRPVADTKMKHVHWLTRVWYLYHPNRKTSAHFENQASDVCKAQYYVWKDCILLAGTGVRKISSVAWVFSSIKINYSVNRIHEVYAFSITYRFSDILLKKKTPKQQLNLMYIYHLMECCEPFVSLQSNLSLYWHGFCDISVTLCYVSSTLSK